MNMNLHEFHTPTSKEHWQVGGVFEAPEDLADAYHVYGVEWDEKEIKYYFDGVLLRSGPNTNWRQPLYLNFDTETMPDWFGLPKDEDLPSTYSIEYVRAWKKRASAPDPLETLNLLAYGGVGQMKFQMGGEPGGEAPDLDDSDWPIEYVGYGCDIPNTNLWFRTKVVIPERIGGFRIAGRDMTLHLFIDDGGEVYVNGETLGSFTTSNGRFKLATDTRPGQTFAIAIRAVNDDVWGELLDAHVDFSGLEVFQKDLQRLALRLFNAKRSARESGERRAYWDAKIDAAVRTAMAGDAFARGDEEGFVEAFAAGNAAPRTALYQAHLLSQGPVRRRRKPAAVDNLGRRPGAGDRVVSGVSHRERVSEVRVHDVHGRGLRPLPQPENLHSRHAERDGHHLLREVLSLQGALERQGARTRPSHGRLSREGVRHA